MEFPRWQPRQTCTRQEKLILERVRKRRRLFAFLREHRHELFDEEFQAELETMYRETGAGKPPLAPARLAMATILQGYLGLSDADAVDMTVLDLRWQMVLDCLGATEPAFAQGTLHDFRARLIRTEMDRRLLERTVELARRSGAFDWKKLPKSLRVAIDSSPLEGCGRVEDTINLLGHAARNVVRCAAGLLGRSPEWVAQRAGIPLVIEASIKKGLDIDWTDPTAKAGALDTLARQVASLETWVREQLPTEISRPPLQECLQTLAQVQAQDLEPDPSGGGRKRIRQGVAEDRRISIEDGEMRHGRKSKSKRFDGYKRHVATDLDRDLILACAITPANKAEADAAPQLKADVERQGVMIGALHVDRGYVASPVTSEVLSQGGQILCKPWVPRNGILFSKSDFKINLRDRTITCPAGETERIRLDSTVEFDPDDCASCKLRARCTTAGDGRGRTVHIADDELLQQRLRKQASTRPGREGLRERVKVEHHLAHVSSRQGKRARYFGVRKNLFDLRRAATIQNLETIHRRLALAEAA